MSTIGYINVSLEIWGSILCLVVALCMRIGKNAKTRPSRIFFRVLLFNIIVLVSDAAAWLFKGHTDPASYAGVRISNFLVFACGYLLLAAFTNYLTSYIGGRTAVSRIPLRLVRIMGVVALVCVVISQFNHMFYSFDANNIYHRESLFWLSQVWGIAGMCVNASLLVRYRKSLSRIEHIALSSYIILPVAAMCIQLTVYGIALLNLATTIAILVVFLLVQTEQARLLQEKETELADSRIAVMLSQIQPHFLYNSLTAIRQLCDSDPAGAKEAVAEFSGCLRGNLDALTAKRCIPFEREMEQVKNYLSLEKRRFGSVLQARFDLGATGFLIPPLTVQPVVENAVRHGITQKPGGGTVHISAYEEKDAFVVTVADDGVGIDPAYMEDGKNHVGLENVRKRVEAMCGGRVAVESRRNEGTMVKITIPKGETYAADCGGR
ncbi:sensor histidine kinase [Christensenella intestinihominis]|uniref:sensor histidine kinase n=1 Tax=Christensenella intestinihominis TaxID=1851429 RepID=UPI000829683D|nr:histidine kinase [Christensenella intestinihominis]